MYLDDQSQSWELAADGEYHPLASAATTETLEGVQKLLLKQFS